MHKIFLTIAIIATIVIYFKKNNKWEVIYESNKRDKEALYVNLAYLKVNNIRCKIDMLNSRGYSSGIGRSSFDTRNQETFQLKAHKNDYKKAKQLLS